ncbi:ATP-dependent RNA helicase SUPV3L1/SUV3 [Rhodopseudomonas julia]|uniref:ATP-dependent RNA helicase SUPV3L1/SUV3 n=1 Tax=Rhodopseudomonas julia TaxID=200617 RepID=A0ABU0C5V3_9BRAD|nr:helicase-related protein [Rhodopseudomonas julia]MDQ0325902.1 ATP-dependent RNA helicase SUPV3L1/SUV3 [Rhodopseudomonas julia]
MNVTSDNPRQWSARNVTAVLGPTNTGKTHLAIERMLGHETGIIGLPLRLLAREVYSRVAQRAGADKVALVTGEEKIVPPEPRYWVSTVEAMPRNTDAAFAAIDEIQLAADLERGHVFTDRILSLRGSQETLLLGASTMRGVIEGLLPGAHIVTRPRMSVLAYAGQKKLTRLPERSAIVAFSADEVYAIGELMRRQRGGAAAVLGALSPRTRNRQVELYQSGDVDFLVATDAIGMGLNLDVDHVAFASARKFDGYQHRPLTAAELGQIAGRAGRYMRDGTFGVTGTVSPFEPPLVEALESHRFEAVRVLQWRNDRLDFSSHEALRASLEQPPKHPFLTKSPPAADQVALELLVRDDDITDRLTHPKAVERLWDICRLPDYRRIAPAQHAGLIGSIFTFLMDKGSVPPDWLAPQVKRADRTDGDIDTLSARIAEIRTWTFVANQPDWLADPSYWREETKRVEDRLSDALHDRLTKRFVDRRTSVLMRRLKENTMLEAEITPGGDVLVEGEHVGTLIGFRFTPDAKAEGSDAKTVRTAAAKALGTAVAERAERLSRSDDAGFLLTSGAIIRWHGEPVARLLAESEPLKPRILLLADEQLTGPSREKVEARLTVWLSNQIGTHLKPLLELDADESLSGLARGIAYQLKEKLGILDRRDVLEEVRSLDQDARAGLRRHGVRFGAYHIYLPMLLKPAPATLLAELEALHKGRDERDSIAEVASVSASGRTSVNVDPEIDPAIYHRFGYRIFGRRAVRIDILERLADLIRPALTWRPGREVEPPAGAIEEGGGFTVTSAMTSLLGASGEDMGVILNGLGYRVERRPLPAAQPETPETADATAEEAVAAEAEQMAEETATADGQDVAATAEAAEAEAPIAASDTLAATSSESADVEEAPREEKPLEGSEAATGVGPGLGAETGMATVEGAATPLAPEEQAPAPETTGDHTAASTEATIADASTDVGGETQAATEAEAKTEPAFLEIWRYGGMPRREERRPSKAKRSPRRATGRGGTQKPAAEGVEAAAAPHGPAPSKPQHKKGKFRHRGEQGLPKRPPQRPQRQEREKRADPDSPFAALAALKEKLGSSDK